MSNELPPLPDSEYSLAFHDEGGMQDAHGDAYTAEQMHAYARAAVLQEREANAAILFDAAKAAAENNDLRAYSLLTGLAAAIRARSTP